MEQIYNEQYYEQYDADVGKISYKDSKDIRDFLSSVAKRIVSDLNPRTILDAGCATGHLVAALRDLGVEAYGLDISEYAISVVREDIKPYCFVGSLTERLPQNMPQRYDLVVTIEVLEHLYAEDGKAAIKNICNLSDNILFCSTPDDLTDKTHLNVQQREYWAKLFAENNFFDDLSYRPTYITPYAMCFRKSENYLRQIEDYERNIRQSEAAHTQTILEWRGAVNDKEVHIQNIEAERRAAEEQWNQKFYNQENLISELNQKAEILETEKKNIETELENKKNDFEILKQEIQKKKFDWTQKEKSLKNKCIEAEEEVYRLQSRLLILEKDLQQSQLEKKNLAVVLEECDKQLNHYHEHYLAAMNQRNDLEQRLRQTQEMYNVISNAACWKITRPVRFLLDAIKCLLKKNHYTHLFCKGLKSLKQNGFSYTWRKVQDRRQHRQNFLTATKPLYSKEELERQKTEKFPREIKFSIVVPLYNTPENFLHEMIQSVIDQTYPNWELCMADGSDEKHAYVKRICQQYTKKDKRILYKKLDKNLGISGNTNACIDMASGDYIGLFDHDDLLHPAALYEVMHAICEKNADFIYTDELTFSDKIENVITAHFKPDFAPDTLRANNYICHFSVFSETLLNNAGKFRSEYDGSQDHDFILRITENAKNIIHIPKILYYWRSHPASVAQDINSKTYAINAGKQAVKDHLIRMGMNAEIESSKAFPTIYRIKYELKDIPLISIIIPNKNHYDDLSKCITSICEFTTYLNYEIIIVDNGSDDIEIIRYYDEIKEKLNIKILKWDHPFNFSSINNFAAQYAKGKHLVFLNNDTSIITADWLQEMLMYAQRPDVGAVGVKLYYPDDTIQHAGIVLGLGPHKTAGHIFYKTPRENVGYMGRLYYAQDLSAVTAACMMVPKKVWDKIGGFDESFEVAFNDVDLCMRIRKAGYLIVWTPYAELYHYESKSRGLEDTPEKRKRFEGEVKRFQQRWAKELAEGDPYYNPNFSLDREDFSLK